jgi:hypothetical protein
MVYADWIRHDYNPETGVYTSIPQHSCLEMICEGGCSENTETGEGICCPEPSIESCTSEQFDEYNCPLCKVVLPCPENASETISSWQIGTSGCYCNPGYIINETGDACVEGCTSYKDCAKGEFCDMTGNITDCKTRPTAGTCRKANKKRIFPGYDFYTYDGKTTRGKYKNTGGMDWFSAMDFCAAIGEPTVSYKDYCPNETTSSQGACVGYRGIDDCPVFKIGVNSNDYWLADLAKNNDCYAYDLTFGADLCAGNGTDKTKDYDNDSPRYALCGKVIEGKSCSDNNNCGGKGSEYFCGYFIYGVEGSSRYIDCITGPKQKGKCFKISDYKESSEEYAWSNVRMDWFSAQNFCASNIIAETQMRMPTIEELACYTNNKMSVTGNMNEGACCKSETASCSENQWRSNNLELFSIPIVHIKNVIKTEKWFWTSSQFSNNNCAAYDFGLNRGGHFYGYRNSHAFAFCKTDKPFPKTITPKCPENASIEITKQQIGSSACYCKEGYFATQEGYCSTCPDEFSQEMTKTANYKKRYLEYTWTNPYQCDYDVYFNSGSHITVEKDCKGSKDGGDERLTLLIGDTYVYNNSKTICPRYDGEKVGTVYHNTNNTIYIQGKNPGGHKGFSINATFKRKK